MASMQQLEPAPLDRPSLSVLRKATQVLFSCAPYPDQTEHTITAIEQHRVGDLTVSSSTRLAVGGNVLDYGGRSGQPHQAFAWLPDVTGDVCWHTIIGLLRAGDRLRLSWRASNNNENHRRVGFHADELRLRVGREAGRKGPHRWEFKLVQQTGPDNSARMVRTLPGPVRRPDLPAAADPEARRALAAQCAPLLGRARRGHLHLDPALAVRVGPQLAAGDVALNVHPDNERSPDELVIVSADYRRVLAHTFLPPVSVADLGEDAEALYVRLRTQGTNSDDAAVIACGVVQPADTNRS